MFDRKEIMKRSWQLSRIGYTASEALQMAWAEAKQERIISERRKREALENAQMVRMAIFGKIRDCAA